MHINRARFAHVSHSPHVLEQSAARKHPALAAHQRAQQVEFLERQRNGSSPDAHRMGRRDQLNRSVNERVIGAHSGRLRATQQRVHARYQLHHAERLRQVIVGARIEPAHLVEFGAFRCEHHNRDVLRRRQTAQLAENLKTVHFGEHDIEQHQIGRLLVTGLEEIATAREPGSFESRLLEGIDGKVSNVCVIFDVVNHARILSNDPRTGARRIAYVTCIHHRANASSARRSFVMDA